MELSQPPPCGAQGAKPTHDFLSLYSPARQDPTPSMAGSYIKTHDFLQPLEQFGKNVTKEGNKVEYLEKSFPPGPLTIVEHILPGGMGAYSISPISYINQSQKVPKPDGIVNVITAAQSSSSNNNDENSNCSSYTGSGFMLWEESNNVNKGKTGKENIAGTRLALRDDMMKIGGPWLTSMDQPSHSSYILNHPSTTFCSFSSSHPLSAPKNQCFVDMVKSANDVQEEDNDEEFAIKKEPSFRHKGATSVKVDTPNPDRKPNSPRSKHSATEQRRRSKINDRFSMLRGIIPHGDQKRDKASFLLEVIEYIQFLQEKLHKYEDLFQGWTNEPPKTTPMNRRPTNGFIDQPQLPSSTPGPAFAFSAKSNDNNSSSVTPTIPTNRRSILDSNTSFLDAIKETRQHPAASLTHICAPDTATTVSLAQPRLSHSTSCTTDSVVSSDKLKDEEVIIERGRISISTIYSQGLSRALTQALKRSGVHAKISVQIDVGKRLSQPDVKENEDELMGVATASTWEDESGEGLKRSRSK